MPERETDAAAGSPLTWTTTPPTEPGHSDGDGA
jgi:hypothetical protein